MGISELDVINGVGIVRYGRHQLDLVVAFRKLGNWNSEALYEVIMTKETHRAEHRIVAKDTDLV